MYFLSSIADYKSIHVKYKKQVQVVDSCIEFILATEVGTATLFHIWAHAAAVEVGASGHEEANGFTQS